MTECVSIKEFYQRPGSIIDVRSPAEFEHAHIPGALSLPLFSNDERAAIGLIYKEEGQNTAVDLGLKFVGPKLFEIVSQTRKIFNNNDLAKIYCWRGGMRSRAMAWLLDFSGFSTLTLEGGYKHFRQWILKLLSLPYNFIVLGGYTGSGKTEILQGLKDNGEQVLDLESFANHSGSSYGTIGKNGFQPSTEQFENEIAVHLFKFQRHQRIWVEDESRLIGSCLIPPPLFFQLRSSPLFFIESSLEDRIQRLIQYYGGADPEILEKATIRLSKRLGGLHTKEIVNAIQQNQLPLAVTKLLQYYDNAYSFTLLKRPKPSVYIKNQDSIETITKKLVDLSQKHS